MPAHRPKPALPAKGQPRQLVRPADYQLLFESSPGLYLLLTPDLEIVTASNEYLAATRRKREEIRGQFLFRVFPDNPSLPEADGVENVSNSLQEVIRTGQPHRMRLQRYDVQDEVSPDRHWLEKYWAPSNYPIFAPGSSELLYIVSRVEDMTDLVKFGQIRAQEELLTDAEELRTRGVESELRQTRRQLRAAANRFTEALQRIETKHRESSRRVEYALWQLETNVRSILRHLDWQKPYYDALTDTDPDRREMLIRTAELAIHRRRSELIFESPAETERLDRAESLLAELKKATGGGTTPAKISVHP